MTMTERHLTVFVDLIKAYKEVTGVDDNGKDDEGFDHVSLQNAQHLLKEIAQEVDDKLTLKVTETLLRLRQSCHEAITGEWDASPDGFNDMIDDAEDALEMLGANVPDLLEYEDTEE